MTAGNPHSQSLHTGSGPSAPAAAEDLLPLVYQELRRLAAGRMAGMAGQTLQPTALVHEAWLRLVGNSGRDDFADRAHYVAATAEAMRHILIDRARRKKAVRHGGEMQRVEMDALQIASPSGDNDDELLAVNEALDRLEKGDPAKAELVKLRYFAGLTIPQAAAALGISEATAKRRWALARAWLALELRSAG